MSSKTPPIPSLPSFPRLISERDAARVLGVSQISLRRGRMDGPRVNRMPVPPYIKLGKSVKYDLADLEHFIAAHRLTPQNRNM